MRQIGRLTDSEQAQRFGDYLTVAGIPAQIEADESDWLIWIRDEEDLPDARDAFQQFQADPQHERFRDVTTSAAAMRRQAEKKTRAANKRAVNVRQEWDKPPTVRVTSLFVSLSILVAVITTDLSDGMGQLCNKSEPLLHHLFIKDVERIGPRIMWDGRPGLQEVASGEVWRLVTPIFIHGTILHILFNMMWLWQFGLVLEPRLGSKRFLFMVLTIAILSNVGQYVANFAASGIQNPDFSIGPLDFRMWFPAFGGMSGVNYGLFGYIWYKSKYDPRANLFINPGTSFLLFGWFIVCILGLIDSVANGAHGFGLLAGIGFAAFPLMLRKK